RHKGITTIGPIGRMGPMTERRISLIPDLSPLTSQLFPAGLAIPPSSRRLHHDRIARLNFGGRTTVEKFLGSARSLNIRPSGRSSSSSAQTKGRNPAITSQNRYHHRFAKSNSSNHPIPSM